ncbi:MAG: hypothetical protein IIB57_01445 [Planctomycetes bacterium]|nr:hypothetical protein [Planctomycetota bacterium]
MAKGEPKPKPKPPFEDPIQAAIDAVERATGEKIADDSSCDDEQSKTDDQDG